MKLKADHTVTEIKKDIPLLDNFDWVAIGIAIFGIILFITLVFGVY